MMLTLEQPKQIEFDSISTSLNLDRIGFTATVKDTLKIGSGRVLSQTDSDFTQLKHLFTNSNKTNITHRHIFLKVSDRFRFYVEFRHA